MRDEEEPADDDEDLLLALACRSRFWGHGVAPAADVPVEVSSPLSALGGGVTGTIGPS